KIIICIYLYLQALFVPYSWKIYKGSVFKDYRHGKGLYSWPDGSKYTGKFYLNRKEGYGIQIMKDNLFYSSTGLPKTHLKQPQLPLDVESSRDTDQGLSEDEDRFILPPDIESYATDSNHLPVPRSLRQELDLHFFVAEIHHLIIYILPRTHDQTA
uniref:Uncharacterized protein n=1 Tax=Sinocyclocheilus anshuiensis TaxID=1608454 RepID=A0A671SPP9_9TELE